MNELYHYGVLGMKWGIRRYQNKDGTLTEAGERRYRSDLEGGMVDRGRRLRADRRTKAGTLFKGFVRSRVISKLFNKVADVAADKLTEKYSWAGKALTVGKYAAKAVNWSMTLRDISAMSKADKADRQETYLDRQQNQ